MPITILSSGYNPGDEKYRRVFEEVNARKMIVMSHCGHCASDKARQLLKKHGIAV
jgi:hypothetical protein